MHLSGSQTSMAGNRTFPSPTFSIVIVVRSGIPASYIDSGDIKQKVHKCWFEMLAYAVVHIGTRKSRYVYICSQQLYIVHDLVRRQPDRTPLYTTAISSVDIEIGVIT